MLVWICASQLTLRYSLFIDVSLTGPNTSTLAVVSFLFQHSGGWCAFSLSISFCYHWNAFHYKCSGLWDDVRTVSQHFVTIRYILHFYRNILQIILIRDSSYAFYFISILFSFETFFCSFHKKKRIIVDFSVG